MCKCASAEIVKEWMDGAALQNHNQTFFFACQNGLGCVRVPTTSFIRSQRSTP